MDLEKLRQILLDMQHSGRLSDIPHTFYDDTREYLDTLRCAYYALEKPLETGDGYRIMDETRNVNDIVQEIFSIRTRQILDLAFQQFDGQYVDRDEARKMLQAERAMYQQIVGAVEQCRRALISGEELTATVADEIPLPLQEDEAPREERKKPHARAKPPAAPYALVHIIQDMDSFMGVDGRVYRLEQGDIITIPEQNADVLCERNIALNIRLNK
jgi:DNA replication factor GINS